MKIFIDKNLAQPVISLAVSADLTSQSNCTKSRVGSFSGYCVKRVPQYHTKMVCINAFLLPDLVVPTTRSAVSSTKNPPSEPGETTSSAAEGYSNAPNNNSNIYISIFIDTTVKRTK